MGEAGSGVLCLQALGAEVIVTFEGTSESGAQFMTRQSYLPSEMHWGYVFSEIIFHAKEGETEHIVDISRSAPRRCVSRAGNSWFCQLAKASTTASAEACMLCMDSIAVSARTYLLACTWLCCKLQTNPQQGRVSLRNDSCRVVSHHSPFGCVAASMPQQCFLGGEQSGETVDLPITCPCCMPGSMKFSHRPT